MRRIERDEQFQAALARERSLPCRWWYLSFCDGEFLGAAIVLASGMAHAVARCHQLGINPGGQVLGLPLPEPPPRGARDRLLDKKGVERLFGPMQRIDSNGEAVEEDG